MCQRTGTRNRKRDLESLILTLRVQIFPQIQSKGYVFQMEVMVRIVDAGYKVEEVGIR